MPAARGPGVGGPGAGGPAARGPGVGDAWAEGAAAHGQGGFSGSVASEEEGAGKIPPSKVRPMPMAASCPDSGRNADLCCGFLAEC